MTSEEYVAQVDRLMNLQNTYLSIFLGILGLATAIFVVFQWRYSDRQIEKVIQKTKRETITEIEGLLGVSKLSEFKDRLDLKDKENIDYAQSQFELYTLAVLHEGNSNLWLLPNALKAYKSYLTRNMEAFDYNMAKLNRIFTDGENKFDFSDPYFGLLVDTLMRYEAEMHQESVELMHLRNQLNSLRIKQERTKA